jgi:hypothetical protein
MQNLATLKKIIYISIAVIFGVIIFIERRNKYLEYHQSEINGRIDTIYNYRSYDMITVKKFEFKIIPLALNNESDFIYNAKSNDSLYKKADNDTLELVKNGVKFYYTVFKW